MDKAAADKADGARNTECYLRHISGVSSVCGKMISGRFRYCHVHLWNQIRQLYHITPQRLVDTRLWEHPGGWNVSTSPVVRSKVTPQNSLSASRRKARISPQIQRLFLWSVYCFGLVLFQTCRHLGMTLYDCDSQVKCEVVSRLSSSSLDDSLAPKKGEENWIPFSYSWWDFKNEKKNNIFFFPQNTSAELATWPGWAPPSL